MTEFSTIYGLFLSKIHDYSILQMEEADLEETLGGYLYSATASFPNCRKDLDNTTDTGFIEELSNIEIDIIVSLMLVEYMKPIINNTSNLSKELTDREFRSYSQANHLKELTSLYQMLMSEAESKKSRYSYRDWGKRK